MREMAQFLYRLIPPRPTFNQDMSASEKEVMEQHFAYWEGLIERNMAIVYGPVLDPTGVWAWRSSTSTMSKPLVKLGPKTRP